MSIKQFLESHQYKMWKEENTDIHRTMYFQKRVDDTYPDSPLCECNDKLLINVDVWTMKYNGINHTSCTVSMVHENQADEWCDLRIYSLKEDQLIGNLEHYEDKMIKLWEVFAE